MKIAHSGSYLHEGILALNAETLPLKRDSSLTLYDALMEFESEHGPPDLVIIEFLGIYPWKIADLNALVQYSAPIVVYAADSTLNLYYYKYLLKFFDYVFVDQKTPSQELQACGIDAYWLPLSVTSMYFRDTMPKNKGISFVGRTTEERLKRTYMLAALHAEFPHEKDFQILQGLSRAEMQDVFASSHTTINENLFNGLTWRVFQALASGTLLLTEANMDGLDVHFEHEKHLLCFDADTLVPLCADILKNPQKFENIAKNGQEACRKYHTSSARAKELFKHILAVNGVILDELPCALDKVCNIAKNSFFKTFGEKDDHTIEAQMLFTAAACIYYAPRLHEYSYATAITYLRKIMQITDDLFLQAKAQNLMAHIASSASKYANAEELFLNSLSLLAAYSKNISEKQQMEAHKFEAELCCSLTTFYLGQKKYSEALKAKRMALVSLSKFSDYKVREIFTSTINNIQSLDENGANKLEASILFSLAQVCFCLGRVVELGLKPQEHILPNNALFLGLSSWRKHYHSCTLDFILPQLAGHGISGQVLPELIKALEQKKVTKTQAEQIYAMAKDNYFDISN